MSLNELRFPVAVPDAQPAAYICPVRTVADLVNNLLLMDQGLPIYGAQYIEHPTRGRCAIAVSPTVSRERVQDARWIGQGESLNAAVIWTRAEQPAAAPEPVALTVDDLWRNDALMALNAEADLPMLLLVKIAKVVEAAVHAKQASA